MTKKLIEESGNTFINIESYRALEKELEEALEGLTASYMLGSYHAKKSIEEPSEDDLRIHMNNIGYRELTLLRNENYNMSAELEWYKKFHDYIKSSALIDSLDYKELCNFLLSEDDR